MLADQDPIPRRRHRRGRCRRDARPKARGRLSDPRRPPAPDPASAPPPRRPPRSSSIRRVKPPGTPRDPSLARQVVALREVARGHIAPRHVPFRRGDSARRRWTGPRRCPLASLPRRPEGGRLPVAAPRRPTSSGYDPTPPATEPGRSRRFLRVPVRPSQPGPRRTSPAPASRRSLSRPDGNSAPTVSATATIPPLDAPKPPDPRVETRPAAPDLFDPIVVASPEMPKPSPPAALTDPPAEAVRARSGRIRPRRGASRARGRAQART